MRFQAFLDVGKTSGIIPEVSSRLVTSKDVVRLTGLTADQLREWTGRRALVQPDMPSRRPGAAARFSWRDVLVLRLLVVLKEQFRVELEAHRALITELERRLSIPFHALWGSRVVLRDMTTVEVGEGSNLSRTGNVLILQLDSHLTVLATEFRLEEPTQQMPLFPAIGL